MHKESEVRRCFDFLFRICDVRQLLVVFAVSIVILMSWMSEDSRSTKHAHDEEGQRARC